MGLTRPRLGQMQTTTSAFDDPVIVLNNNASSGINNTKDMVLRLNVVEIKIRSFYGMNQLMNLY